MRASVGLVIVMILIIIGVFNMEQEIYTIDNLWKSFYYIVEKKKCDKESIAWGKVLLYTFQTKKSNGYNGSVLDFIVELYNTMCNNKEFASAYENLYLAVKNAKN
jgi:hypothetical protein